MLLVKKYVKVPRSLEGAKSILLLPLFGTILTGFVMLAVNIPMAAINTGMNNFLGGLEGGSAVLLGVVLGGMMAVDMGGPVNKAAYVFGTGTLAATVATGGSVAWQQLWLEEWFHHLQSLRQHFSSRINLPKKNVTLV